MDLKSAICRYLIQQKFASQRVYQDRLPQRDGPITGGLPAVVVRLISDRTLSSNGVILNGQICLVRRQAARIQFDIIGRPTDRQLETLKDELIGLLVILKGNLWGLEIEAVISLNRYDKHLDDVELNRIIKEFKVVYKPN